MSIEVNNVSKLFGTQKALDEVSFSVQSGDIVGFLGPNGAGKSTIMKIITGFIPPTSGEIKVKGLDVLKDSLEIRKIIGYLPENNPLYHDMYIKEYLEFVAGIYKLGSKSKARIKEMISQTGLEVEQNKKIGALSKGYRQRVGLAQTLIHDPEVLILDEPTSGLDPNQIVEIRNLISEVGKEKTVMLSTHIMQEVEAICDKIIIINKGRIVASENTNTIQNRVFESQITILVEFNKNVSLANLKLISGVEDVAYLENNKFLIQTNSKIDIREHIFHFAVKNNLVLLSMYKQEKSLEDVFRELTK
jgi:ABC-2 type transport system ATP-binding protein